MWNMSNRQAQALEVALLEEAAEKRRAEEKARDKAKPAADADREEWDLTVSDWEEAGLIWLKKGQAIFGPTFDFQSELRRLAQSCAEAQRLPYEDLTDLGANVYAGLRTAFFHGIVALILSAIALAAGIPVWLCVILGVFFLVWRFLARRGWLIQPRSAAQALRSEVFAPRSKKHVAKEY